MSLKKVRSGIERTATKWQKPQLNKQKLVAQGYFLAWRLVRYLPYRWAAWLLLTGADWVSDNGKGMEQLRRNLSRVVGKDQVTALLVRNSMRSYARYWLEAFRLPQLVGDSDLIARIDRGVIGKEHLVSSVNSDRGTVLVATHSGNWDMAGMYLVHTFGTFSTVAERLKPVELYDAFVAFRKQLGFNVISHVTIPGQPPAMHQLKQVLEAGGTVCLLGDRDIKGTGVEVEFFGEKTTMPTGAVRLAEETGANLHVVHCWFEGTIDDPSWGLHISPHLPVQGVAETVQKMAALMEENIRVHPVDWHVLQPFWLADRKQKRIT